MTVSVVIPVLNGERYLKEVLDAVNAQQLDEDVEVLVIDSGSRDNSVAISRAGGARVLEIPNAEFQHGRTRNLGVEQTSGRLIAFLTQDATPASPHWLAAYCRAFELDPKVGAAYGPHLPRPDLNPLMARLLSEFFGAMAPDGEPVVHRAGDSEFLSNSNSCISRALWNEIPFRELPYSEDRALGQDLLAAGWTKVCMPDAAALHSHDYGMWESFKRFFDEYRGLRHGTGEEQKGGATRVFGILGRSVAADYRWLRQDPRYGPAATAWWTARSVIYHCGRVLFGGLGARADRLPAWLRRRLSLEGRDDGTGHSGLSDRRDP